MAAALQSLCCHARRGGNDRLSPGWAPGPGRWDGDHGGIDAEPSPLKPRPRAPQQCTRAGKGSRPQPPRSRRAMNSITTGGAAGTVGAGTEGSSTEGADTEGAGSEDAGTEGAGSGRAADAADGAGSAGRSSRGGATDPSASLLLHSRSAQTPVLASTTANSAWLDSAAVARNAAALPDGVSMARAAMAPSRSVPPPAEPSTSPDLMVPASMSPDSTSPDPTAAGSTSAGSTSAGSTSTGSASVAHPAIASPPSTSAPAAPRSDDP